MKPNIHIDVLDRQIQQFLTNKYVSQVMTLGLILYAVLVAPRLSREMSAVIDNPVVKMIVFFSIAYMATKDYKIAISLVIAYVITMQTCEKHHMNDKLVSAIVADQVAVANKNDIVTPAEQIAEQIAEQEVVVKQDIAPIAEGVEGAEEEAEVQALFQTQEGILVDAQESEGASVPVDEVDISAIMANDPVAVGEANDEEPVEGFGDLVAFNGRSRGGISSMQF